MPCRLLDVDRLVNPMWTDSSTRCGPTRQPDVGDTSDEAVAAQARVSELVRELERLRELEASVQAEPSKLVANERELGGASETVRSKSRSHCRGVDTM